MKSNGCSHTGYLLCPKQSNLCYLLTRCVSAVRLYFSNSLLLAVRDDLLLRTLVRCCASSSECSHVWSLKHRFESRWPYDASVFPLI